MPSRAAKRSRKMAVGESARELRKSQQGMAQGLDLRVREAQGRGALLVYLTGAMHLLEGLFGEHTVMADFLDFE